VTILHKAGAKKFLTDRTDEASSIVWTVTADKSRVGRTHVDAGLTLRDCNKTVHIDFDAYSEPSQEDLDSRLAKVDVLITELFLFREAIHVGYTKAIEEFSYVEKED
jgi:hypothetical protein